MTREDATGSTISRRPLSWAGLLGACLLLAGCSSQIKALATDPAIIGVTTCGLHLGAVPSVVGLPIPGLLAGCAHAWRIGPRTDSVEVLSGQGATGPAGTVPGKLESRGSLLIRVNPSPKPAE